MIDGRRETVLIIEDDPGIARLEARGLERAGYAVVHAVSAEEARRFLGQGAVDLIVLDQRLQGAVSGLDLYAQLKADGIDLPAILVTGLSDEETLVRAIRSGLRDFVPKTPDHVDDLVRAVDRVTTQVRTARRLAESEARLAGIALLAEAIPQLVWGARADGAMEFFNRRWVEYTGMPQERSAGSGWYEAVHPEDRGLVLHRWQKALWTGKPYEIECRLRTREGAFRWQLVRGLPLFDHDGQVGRWFGTFTDIDDRKHDEEVLMRAKEGAETASRAKDQFLAMLSHELRTPLTPVLVSVTALLEDPETPDNIRPTLEVTRRNVELEARLIDDLLDITRISQGKLRLNREVSDAHGLARQALEICRDEIAAAGLNLKLDLTAARHHVDADPARFQQVVWNLIKNAVKFTPTGGAITIRTQNRGDRLILSVADTGIGIDPQILPRIFNAFDQGETAYTQRFGGLGLGLAISRSLAEAHGGRLVAESLGRGLGATFTLDLGTVSAPVFEANGAPQTHLTPPPPSSLHILLVEDNVDTLRVMAGLLRLRGYRVTTADSVAAAYQAAEGESFRFDVIVSDIGLPDGSGLDLMRRIQSRSAIRGIALSGFGTEEDVNRSRAAGFITHLTKPLDFAKLETTIRQVAAAGI